MNNTIWKFFLQIADEQIVTLPEGAVLLSVQMQDGNPQLWAHVDSKARKVSRKLLTFGTGHPCVTTAKFVGTYQTGSLVFHLFDAGEV